MVIGHFKRGLAVIAGAAMIALPLQAGWADPASAAQASSAAVQAPSAVTQASSAVAQTSSAVAQAPSAFVQSPAAAAQPDAASGQHTDIRVVIDGEPRYFTPAPIQQQGITLVPMRQIFDALGAQVTWEATTRSIFAKKGSMTVALMIDSRQAAVNGTSMELAVPPRIINGVTMVPLRLVSEAFDAETTWNAAERTITIETAAYRFEQERLREEEAKAARPKLTAAEIVERNDDAVVMIMTDRGQGSGVIVGGRWVLTNYHVINNASEGEVVLNDGTSIDIVGVAAANERADLAIVQTVRSLHTKPVAFAELHSVRKGDRVVAIGSPLGFRNTVSEGLVSNTSYERGVLYYQINAPIDHGSSGGALFNEYGELVGITTSGVKDTMADLNFAVAAHYGEWLLADLEFDPPNEDEIRFPPSSLPDSLEDATDEEIRVLLEYEYGELFTVKGLAEFTDWNVERDSQGWLVITALIDPAFYMLYGHATADELRFWALNLGTELRRMLPDTNIELTVYYSRTFNAEPRGFAPGVVTRLDDDRWQVQYAVIHLQYMDRMHISVNT